MNTRRFTDQTVLITGASRGIGKGLAQRFASEGANLMLAANEDAVFETAAELEKEGTKVKAERCDVTSKDQVESLFQHTVETFGQVDVSVQNAGVITISKLEELSR